MIEINTKFELKDKFGNSIKSGSKIRWTYLTMSSAIEIVEGIIQLINDPDDGLRLVFICEAYDIKWYIPFLSKQWDQWELIDN